jgi:hypothetical protein
MRTDIAAAVTQAAFAVALERATGRWLGDLDALSEFVAQPEASAVLRAIGCRWSRRKGSCKRPCPTSIRCPESGAPPRGKTPHPAGPAGAREFGDLLDAHEGAGVATVTTAVPLSGEQRQTSRRG